MKGTAIRFYLWVFVTTAAYFACTTNSETNQRPVVKNEPMTISATPGKSWVAKQLGNNESLATVQFVDQAHGWVISRKGKIHLTTDGGETWETKQIDIPAGAEVASSFLVDTLTGWISVVRMSTDVLLPNETRAWVMKTEDGGNSWLTQYSQQAVRIDRLWFVSARDGWAVGSRTIKRETLQDDPFVLHSSDAGQHWEILSDALPRAGGGLEDTYYDKSLGLLVLNSEGLVFSTSDGGEHWRTIATVPDEPSQTFFGRFGRLADKRFWFLGGSSSYEGTYGVLSFKGPDNTWTKLKTHAYLNDVLFLTADKIVACGFIYERSESNPARRGIILRSTDGGRSWVTDLPPRSNAFKALSRAGDRTIWVIGEDGYIAKLEDF